MKNINQRIKLERAGEVIYDRVLWSIPMYYKAYLKLESGKGVLMGIKDYKKVFARLEE